MNDIRSVDFSDAQLKSLLFEVYSAGFEAGYPRCTDIHTGFNTWYRDVIQKDNLPVYAALDSTDKDVRDAIDSVFPALDAWAAETNACFGQKGKGQADIDLRRDGTSPFWNVPFSLPGKTH